MGIPVPMPDVTLQLSGKERKVLAHLLVTAVVTKTRLQRRWFDDIFIKLELDDFEQQLQTVGVILPDAEMDTASLAYSLPLDVSEYLLKLLDDTEAAGAQARVLLHIADRLETAVGMLRNST